MILNLIARLMSLDYGNPVQLTLTCYSDRVRFSIYGNNIEGTGVPIIDGRYMDNMFASYELHISRFHRFQHVQPTTKGDNRMLLIGEIQVRSTTNAVINNVVGRIGDRISVTLKRILNDNSILHCVDLDVLTFKCDVARLLDVLQVSEPFAEMAIESLINRVDGAFRVNVESISNEFFSVRVKIDSDRTTFNNDTIEVINRTNLLW